MPLPPASPRLQFRRYEHRDLDFLAALLADPEAMRYIGAGLPLAREAAAQRLERHLTFEEGRGWFIASTRDQDAVPVGHFAIVRQSVESREDIEIGWCVAPHAWGCGYATEGAAVMRDYALRTLGDRRIIHIIAPENVRSIAVARRIGSQFERAAMFRGRAVHIYSQLAAQ